MALSRILVFFSTDFASEGFLRHRHPVKVPLSRKLLLCILARNLSLSWRSCAASVSRLVSIRVDPLFSEPTFIGRLGVASSIIQFVWSAAGTVVSRRLSPYRKASSVRTFCISCAPSPPSQSVFCFPQRYLCCAVCICVFIRANRCMEPCTFFLFGWPGPVCARAARHGFWLFDSSPGFHSPLCPPDGCAPRLSGFRTP